MPGRLRRPRPLVVLPGVTWQALNPLDDDLDGFADTFPPRAACRWTGEFAGGALPAGLSGRPRRCCASSIAPSSPTT